MRENKDFHIAVMPSEDTRILEFNQYRTSEMVTSIIYADLESLIKKVDGCKNNLVESSATKIALRIFNVYDMTFDGLENKHDLYRGEDRIEKFFEALKEHAMKTINFSRKCRK